MGRNQGTEFENELKLIFSAYKTQGRATLEKVDPPSKVLGNRVIYMENPFLDFVGSWTEQGGRALFIEAKATDEPRLLIGGKSNSNGMKDNQLANALAWWRAGAMVLVLWRFQGEVRVFTPAMAKHATMENGRRSLRFCDAHRLPSGYGFLRYDPLTWAKALL